MKKIFVLLLTVFIYAVSFAQPFEGEVVYRNSYKIKIAGLTDEKFTEMMGTEQQYYIKGGAYKSVINGTLVQWQLYTGKDNKLYSKMSSAEEAFWNDAETNSDEVLKATVNKGALEILGYKCDELVLTCKSGVQKYYYNAALPVDARLFMHHKFGNWYDVVKRTNALPLKMIIENEEFTLESVAIEVRKIKLEPSFFDLPAGIQTKKNPH